MVRDGKTGLVILDFVCVCLQYIRVSCCPFFFGGGKG